MVFCSFYITSRHKLYFPRFKINDAPKMHLKRLLLRLTKANIRTFRTAQMTRFHLLWGFLYLVWSLKLFLRVHLLFLCINLWICRYIALIFHLTFSLSELTGFLLSSALAALAALQRWSELSVFKHCLQQHHLRVPSWHTRTFKGSLRLLGWGWGNKKRFGKWKLKFTLTALNPN